MSLIFSSIHRVAPWFYRSDPVWPRPDLPERGALEETQHSGSLQCEFSLMFICWHVFMEIDYNWLFSVQSKILLKSNVLNKHFIINVLIYSQIFKWNCSHHSWMSNIKTKMRTVIKVWSQTFPILIITNFLHFLSLLCLCNVKSSCPVIF